MQVQRRELFFRGWAIRLVNGTKFQEQAGYKLSPFRPASKKEYEPRMLVSEYDVAARLQFIGGMAESKAGIA